MPQDTPDLKNVDIVNAKVNFARAVAAFERGDLKEYLAARYLLDICMRPLKVDAA